MTSSVRQRRHRDQPGRGAEMAVAWEAPVDASHFEEPDGATIAPETLRRREPDLVGKRLVHAGAAR